MEGMVQLVQMTAAYSNAVLVAILPHFTEVARTLHLPIQTPITPSSISRCYCDPRAGEVGGWVVLTNGCQFWYEKGHVRMFHSPRDYFVLQNPDWIPKLYGRLNLNRQEAVALARQSLKDLGCTNEVLVTQSPDVTLASPEDRFAIKQGVPQYQIAWHDPDLADRRPFDVLAEVNVNAEVKHVDGFVLDSQLFWRPNPVLKVQPAAMPQTSFPSLVGGRKLDSLSGSLSNNCLATILPRISDFARRLRLPITLPISAEDCSNIACSLEDGRPNLQIILTNGDRFNFRHGCVMDFYSGDNYFTGDLYGSPLVRDSDLYQPQPVSKANLIAIARQAVRQLGYSERLLHMEGPPDMVTIPRDFPGSYFSRYEIAWDFRRLPSGLEGYRVEIEVDAKSRTIKSIWLDNPAFWKDLPRIDSAPPDAHSRNH